MWLIYTKKNDRIHVERQPILIKDMAGKVTPNLFCVEIDPVYEKSSLEILMRIYPYAPPPIKTSSEKDDKDPSTS